MSLLAKLWCITVDVTGTLLAYKGGLGEYYCMAAKAVGLECPGYKRVHEGFKYAYKDMATKYPCFGYAAKMPNIIWWKTCVGDSFIRAGYQYDEETFENRRVELIGILECSLVYKVWRNQTREFMSLCLEGLEIWKGWKSVTGQGSAHRGQAQRLCPSNSIGMHALLLDRFKTSDADEWLFPDLEAAKEWLTTEKSAS